MSTRRYTSYASNYSCFATFLITSAIPLAQSLVIIIDADTQWLFKIYIFECSLSALMFFLCFVLFARAFFGYRVVYFPIFEMAKSIQGIYDSNNTEPFADNKNVESAVSAFLAKRFINDAIQNRRNNRQKSRRQIYLIWAIIFAFIVVFSCFVTAFLISVCYADSLSESLVREDAIWKIQMI